MSAGSGAIVVYETVFDVFERTVVSGWGTVWTTVGTATVSVDGTRGKVVCSGSQEAEMTVPSAGPWSIGRDFTMTALVQYDWSTNANRLVVFGLGAPSEPVSLNVEPRSTGFRVRVTGSNSATDTTFNPGTGNPFWIKWQHSPDDLQISRARVWLDGDPEPTTWLVSRSTTSDSYGAATDEFSIFVQSPSSTFTVYVDSIDFGADPVLIYGR